LPGEGVVWTDVIQGGLMLLGGGIVIFFLMVVLSPDQIGEPLTHAWSNGKMRYIDFTFDPTAETIWVFAFAGLFHYLTKYTTDQTMVQRYLLAPSVKDATKGALLGIGCCYIAWFMFFGIGSMLWGFYDLHPGRLPDYIDKPDKVFPYFIGSELPVGITGLVLAGLFSSALSTISSDINCIGACVTSDFYDRFSKKATETKRLIVGKVSVLVSGILTVCFALIITRYEGGIVRLTMDVGAYIGAIIAGGALAMFLLGFFTRRVTKQSMYIAP
jgi:SSS family solute:Na+ symporter